MNTIPSLLAVALLTSPIVPLEMSANPDLHATAGPVLQKLAVQWEILDPRELRYVLTRTDSFYSDLSMLQQRYKELTDAPFVSDCRRFPDRRTISELLAFNRAYRERMDNRQAVELVHWWSFHVAVQEADQLYNIWDTARDACCEYYYVSVRRQALKQLREMIGDQAYYGGCLPPHVPVWRFEKID